MATDPVKNIPAASDATGQALKRTAFISHSSPDDRYVQELVQFSTRSATTKFSMTATPLNPMNSSGAASRRASSNAMPLSSSCRMLR